MIGRTTEQDASDTTQSPSESRLNNSHLFIRLLCYSTALAAFDLSNIKNPDVDHDRVSLISTKGSLDSRPVGLTSSCVRRSQIIQERFIKDSQFIKIMTSEIVR